MLFTLHWRLPPYLIKISSALASSARHVLVLADDAALRRRLPIALEQAGFGAYVAHDVSDALELAQQHPPHAVVLDLLQGTEDAWRRMKPAVAAAHLVVAGKFTPSAVAGRLHAEAYVANADVDEIVTAVQSLNAQQ